MNGRRDEHPELPVDPDTPAQVRLGALMLVFAGGMVGTLARYGLARAEPGGSGRWPWGTFAANIVGAFLLGLLLEGLARRGPDVGARHRWRLLAGTGFCGALTTYSTLAVETDLLVRVHDVGLAAAYLATSLVTGVCAVGAGIVVAGHPRSVR